MQWSRYRHTGSEPGPSARFGHCAVKVVSKVWGGTLAVFHGGTSERQALGDLVVLHVETGVWSRPKTNSGPGARAFHSCAVIGTDVYFFGGRTGTRRHADAWKLATDLWEWTPLQVEGAKPDARERSECVTLDTNRILLFGGYDGIRWLNEVHILHTSELEWTRLQVAGPLPAPRSGHRLEVIQHRVLLFGGETTATQYLGDLWALTGLFGEEPPRWVKMTISGSSPSNRAGHSLVNVGWKLVVYGGQGDEGWLTRKDVYYRDVAVIDRENVRWMKTDLAPGQGEPPERAYHSMVYIPGVSKLLVFGGFDGKVARGDMWYLDLGRDAPRPPTGPSGSAGAGAVSEATSSLRKALDPAFGLIGSALRVGSGASKSGARVDADGGSDLLFAGGKDWAEEQALSDLRDRLGLPAVPRSQEGGRTHQSETNARLISLGTRLDPAGEISGGSGVTSTPAGASEPAMARARSYFSTADPGGLKVEDLDALLRDYRSLLGRGLAELRAKGEDVQELGKWNHVEGRDVRMGDVEGLLAAYRRVLSVVVQMT